MPNPVPFLSRPLEPEGDLPLVTDRLRAAGAEGEQLDAVLRLIAVGKALDAAAVDRLEEWR